MIFFDRNGAIGLAFVLASPPVPIFFSNNMK